MGGFAHTGVLAILSLLGSGFWSDASAQTPKPEDAPPPRKKPVDVYNRIEGESTIVKLKPGGTVVKKGEWVVEFDSTDLRDALAVQKVGVKAAETAHRGAKMTREVAEIGIKEFTDGISKEDIERADEAIAKATAERIRAEDNAKTSKSAELQLALTEAQITEQKAKAKKAILLKYTEARNLKELQSEVFKAKEEELKREADWQRETSKCEKLRREVEACKVLAPIAGTIGYLRPVEQEDTFQQGEVLFRIFPERPKLNPKPK